MPKYSDHFYTENGVLKQAPYKVYIFEDELPVTEQWLVVEWLRVNHGIWIEVVISENKKFESEIYNTKNLITKHIFDKHSELYNTPQEAYSTAFDYIKENNLI